MEPFRLRRATIQDVPAIAIFARRAFGENFTHYDPSALVKFLDEHYHPDRFSSYLQDEQNTVWLAQENGEIIGYTGFGRYKLPLATPVAPVIELHRLYVLKSWQGKKVGVAMMQRLFECAQERKARAIYLGVWENNHKAQQFYASYGFTKVGEYDYPPIGTVVDREWIMMKML